MATPFRIGSETAGEIDAVSDVGTIFPHSDRTGLSKHIEEVLGGNRSILKLVTLIQQAKCFCDHVDGRGVAAGSDSFGDNLFELGCERNAHCVVFGTKRPSRIR